MRISGEASASSFKVELGTLPDWLAAIGTILAFLAALGLLFIEQRNRRADLEQAQARMIGAHIDWHPGGVAGRHPLTMTVTNASPLPIRCVTGFVREVDDLSGSRGWIQLESIPVVPQGTSSKSVYTKSGDALSWHLVIEFDDDAGVRWCKYGPRRNLVQADRSLFYPIHSDHLGSTE